MARSRKSVEALIGEALAALAEPASDDRPLAVAFSGGLDSTVLLHGAVRVLGPRRVLALHVHHGLLPQADGWEAHAASRAAALGAGFRALRAAGAPARGDSVERWAREVRYALLGEAARDARACALATAHHADDQLETLLLALSRGCGLDGLTGIAPGDRRGGVVLSRPLLALDRAALHAHALAHGLDWVEDPSNADPAVARSALRHRVLPALRDTLPGVAANLADALDALRDARAIVDACAAEDLAAARGDGPVGTIDRRVVAALPRARGDAALRAWVRTLGEPPPSRAKLAALRVQLLDAAAASATLRHGGHALHRYRDRLWAEPARDGSPAPDAVELQWSGEATLPLPDGGRLRFEPCACGLDADWLSAQRLRVGPVASSARWRPDPARPSRTLKNLRQEAGVPPALRARMPAVTVGGRLLWAAPFGLDRDPAWPLAARGMTIAWEPADGASGDWLRGAAQRRQQ
ncbi:MAG: tRNA(Ile)-lysidine synthase [Pseudomonadota bacterium]|jgi:tRNA(Ile)-lysidine synthase